MKAMMKVVVALALLLSAVPASANEICSQADWILINSALRSERALSGEFSPDGAKALRAALAKRGKRSCQKIAENQYRNGEVQGKSYVIEVDGKNYSAFFALQNNEAIMVNVYVYSPVPENY